MKKLFALVLAACLMLSAVAFATGSKTSDDLTDVVDVETEVETEDTIDVELAMSEEAEAVLGKIAEQGVEETFGEALEDANDWTLTELVEIEIEGYEEEDGSLTVTLASPPSAPRSKPSLCWASREKKRLPGPACPVP
ncbi:MAG: hypothetical protein IJ240_03520 [Clostridia bacterium]|nr:hypothetical protein [Clostridia bacterium]